MRLFILEKAWLMSLGFLMFGLITIALQKDNQFTKLFLPFEFGLLLLSVALPFFLRLLLVSFSSLPEVLEKFTNFSEEDFKKYQISRWASLFIFIIGILISIGGVSTILVLGLPWQSAARALFQIWLYVTLFGYGVIAGLYVHHIRLLFSLSRLETKSSPFYWPKTEILYLYRIYSKLLAAGTGLYVLAIVSFWSTPGNWLVNAWLDNITFSTAIKMGVNLIQAPWRLIESLWVFPVAICIFFFFFLFNYACHELLVQCQTKSVEHFNKLASKALEEWEKNPNKEKQEQIDKLLEWRDQLKKEKVWPLDLIAILSIITTTVIPIIQTFINFAKAQING